MQPPDLDKTDSHVFFQYKLDTDAYAVDTIADLEALAATPAGLLGYQAIGHGNAAVPVTAAIPSGTLASNQNYDYRVIAVDLNGITVGDDQHFKTTKAAFKDDVPAFEWEDVDISHIKPRPRRYDATA